MTTTEMTPAERWFAALARDKALSFFAANPDVRPASMYGVCFGNGFAELMTYTPGPPCACLLTPLLLLSTESTLCRALAALAAEHGVDESFLTDLTFGWDVSEGLIHANYGTMESYLAANHVRREIEKMRERA